MAGVPRAGLEVVGEPGDARLRRGPGRAARSTRSRRAPSGRGTPPGGPSTRRRTRPAQSAGTGTVSTRMPPSASSRSREAEARRTARRSRASGRYSSTQPEVASWIVGVPGEDHDPAGDPPHLGEPGPPVGPVVDREDGERGVERAVAERAGARRRPAPPARHPAAAGRASPATARSRRRPVRRSRRSRSRRRRSRPAGRHRARRGSAPRPGDRRAGSRCRCVPIVS